ncbi:MAG TPA: hypothetical protein VGO59_02665 [Verrucomicrobiae bacterium]
MFKKHLPAGKGEARISVGVNQKNGREFFRMQLIQYQSLKTVLRGAFGGLAARAAFGRPNIEKEGARAPGKNRAQRGRKSAGE